MMTTLSNSALAWLLTYAIHSTVLLALAWLVSRRAPASPAARDFIWKVALVGGIVTSSLQLELGVRPNGSVALSAAAAQVAPSDAPLTSREPSGARFDRASAPLVDAATVDSASMPGTSAPAAATRLSG